MCIYIYIIIYVYIFNLVSLQHGLTQFWVSRYQEIQFGPINCIVGSPQAAEEKKSKARRDGVADLRL